MRNDKMENSGKRFQLVDQEESDYDGTNGT